MKQNRNRRGTFGLGVLAALAVAPQSNAQTQDALLDKLVSKGVLTQDEAKDLREEADEGFKKSYQAKSGMPDWVTAMRFNGDFRGRYEGFFTDKMADRNRWRYRLRFGFTATMLDNFEVGFRLGSGDASAGGGLIDPISNNQTLENNASKKGVYIDLAYGKWSPINNANWQVSLVGGKMENPFVFSDILFDHDYTPEGAAVQVKYTVNDQHAFRLISGAFVLDEIGGSSKDPFMAGAQARLDSTWDAKQRIQSSIGVGVFVINHDEGLTNGAVPNINYGNSRSLFAGNPLREGFNPIVLDGSLTYSLDSFPMYPTKFPIKLAGDYIHNPAAGSDRDGYSVGLTLGKSGKKKTWELSYRWKELQANSWYEEFTDSDSGAYYKATDAASGLGAGYRSGTNIRGHVVKASYSPYDAFTFGITYANLEAIHENPIGSGSSIGRLQIDAIWKF